MCLEKYITLCSLDIYIILMSWYIILDLVLVLVCSSGSGSWSRSRTLGLELLSLDSKPGTRYVQSY